MSRCTIKADDFRGIPSEAWQRFIDRCDKEDIPASIGFIAKNVYNGKSVDPDLIKGVNKGPFEVWNHGLHHSKDKNGQTTEFFGRSYNDQVTSLTGCQDICEDIFGFRPCLFGPPFNQYDVNTIRALESVPELSAAYDIPYVPGMKTLPGSYFVQCEGPASGRKFNHKQATERADHYIRHESPFILQIHPGNHWTPDCLDAFSDFVRYVRRKGYQFVLSDDLFV